MLALFRFPFSAMGSRCEVRLYARDETPASACAQAAIADVRRLDAKYSRYRTDSVTAEMNRVAARGGPIDVDAETATLLDYAETCFEQSDGLFDITSGVLREAWHSERKTLPEPALLNLCHQRHLTPVRVVDSDPQPDGGWVEVQPVDSGRTFALAAIRDDPMLTVVVRPDGVIASVATRSRLPDLPWGTPTPATPA